MVWPKLPFVVSPIRTWTNPFPDYPHGIPLARIILRIAVDAVVEVVVVVVEDLQVVVVKMLTIGWKVPWDDVEVEVEDCPQVLVAMLLLVVLQLPVKRSGTLVDSARWVNVMLLYSTVFVSRVEASKCSNAK